MTAVTLHTDLVPAHRGWRALLWMAPLTALWIVLNYAFPIIPASAMSTFAARLGIHVLIALGLWLSLERAELTPAQRRNAWLGVMIPAFAVPSSILLHVLSLRQLRRRSR